MMTRTPPSPRSIPASTQLIAIAGVWSDAGDVSTQALKSAADQAARGIKGMEEIAREIRIATQRQKDVDSALFLTGKTVICAGWMPS